jgi:Cu-processing system permease protein
MVVLYDLLLLGLVLADTEQSLSASVFGGLILLNPADIYRLFNLAGSDAASLVSGSTGLLEASVAGPGMLLGLLVGWIAVPLLISMLIFQRRQL